MKMEDLNVQIVRGGLLFNLRPLPPRSYFIFLSFSLGNNIDCKRSVHNLSWFVIGGETMITIKYIIIIVTISICSCVPLS